jgi:hypothetical protein
MQILLNVERVPLRGAAQEPMPRTAKNRPPSGDVSDGKF